MKVRLIKQKEINGEMGQPGWVYGVDEPTAKAWIDAGEAVAVQEEARALKYAETVPVMVVCVDPNDDAPQEKGALAVDLPGLKSGGADIPIISPRK